MLAKINMSVTFIKKFRNYALIFLSTLTRDLVQRKGSLSIQILFDFRF